MEQSQSKLTFRPPLPSIRVLASPKANTALLPPAPHSPPIKRTSASKSIQRISVEKSRREKEIEQEIKYTKNVRAEAKGEPSFIQSETNTLASPPHRLLEDTQSTLQKVKSLSREKREDNWRRSDSIERTQTKMFDSLSGVSQSNRRNSADKEDFYLYWKNKAHEYLQANMKLMDQLSRLTKQNEDLKETIERMKHQQPKGNIKEQRQPEPVVDVRAMSMHYLHKIEEMEKELKRKQIIIVSYEIKMGELTQAIVGDAERIKIIAKLKQEIQQLKDGNAVLLNNANRSRKNIESAEKQKHQRIQTTKNTMYQ